MKQPNAAAIRRAPFAAQSRELAVEVGRRSTTDAPNNGALVDFIDDGQLQCEVCDERSDDCRVVRETVCPSMPEDCARPSDYADQAEDVYVCICQRCIDNPPEPAPIGGRD